MKLKYTDIAIIRHGQTAWNKEGRVQGQCDIGIDEKGLSEAEQSGRYLLLTEQYSALYSSDLRRTMQTAGIISSVLGLSIEVDSRLREIAAGKWEGIIYAEVSRKERSALSSDPHNYRFPGGETWKEVEVRTQKALSEIVLNHIGERVVVVTHGGPIRSVLNLWGDGCIESLPVPNGSVTKLRWYEGVSKPEIITVGFVPLD